MQLITILLLITCISADIKVGCGEGLTLEDKRQMDMGAFECPTEVNEE